MKKFVNDADTFVRESLEGLVLTQPGLALLEGPPSPCRPTGS